jgi:hypothetical protein
MEMLLKSNSRNINQLSNIIYILRLLEIVAKTMTNIFTLWEITDESANSRRRLSMAAEGGALLLVRLIK